MKTIALILVAAITMSAGYPMRAEAMLVPAGVTPAQPQINRSADIQVIQKALESKLLKNSLQALGLSEKEIDSRLQKMSDQQVHQLASQIRAVQPAGDAVVYVLVVVALILVIIYLVRRV